jgi:hypothetical protein
MVASRVRYRFWQFFSMVLGCFRPVDIAYVGVKLSSARLLELFERMPRMEQNHGIAVCKSLEQQGFSSPDLFTAALLHDVGKIEYFPRIWERVYTVLVVYIAPHLASRMAQGHPKGLKRGFVVRRFHGDWGADLAKYAGASPRTTWLIREHHTTMTDDHELAALQVVDDN